MATLNWADGIYRFKIGLIDMTKTVFALFLFLACCGHNSQMKEHLEERNPDCIVTDNLRLICPNPFGNEAGFGMGVKTIKPETVNSRGKSD